MRFTLDTINKRIEKLEDELAWLKELRPVAEIAGEMKAAGAPQSAIEAYLKAAASINDNIDLEQIMEIIK